MNGDDTVEILNNNDFNILTTRYTFRNEIYKIHGFLKINVICEEGKENSHFYLTGNEQDEGKS